MVIILFECNILNHVPSCFGNFCIYIHLVMLASILRINQQKHVNTYS